MDLLDRVRQREGFTGIFFSHLQTAATENVLVGEHPRKPKARVLRHGPSGFQIRIPRLRVCPAFPQMVLPATNRLMSDSQAMGTAQSCPIQQVCTIRSIDSVADQGLMPALELYSRASLRLEGGRIRLPTEPSITRHSVAQLFPQMVEFMSDKMSFLVSAPKEAVREQIGG